MVWCLVTGSVCCLQKRGYYREYTVKTPAHPPDRGMRRIVCGGPKTAPDACYYTADHYASFRKIRALNQIFVEREAEMDTPLRTVRTNIVQSIRAFRVPDLQEAAQAGSSLPVRQPGQRPEQAGRAGPDRPAVHVAGHFGKNFDALYDSMTDPVHKSGPQPGFIVVLEHIPANAKFDKEAREQLLDIFRDAADYWGDRKIPFRCFYSFL
jgi:hypothetical protein